MREVDAFRIKQYDAEVICNKLKYVYAYLLLIRTYISIITAILLRRWVPPQNKQCIERWKEGIGGF